jgi:hypothetical protein
MVDKINDSTMINTTEQNEKQNKKSKSEEHNEIEKGIATKRADPHS